MPAKMGKVPCEDLGRVVGCGGKENNNNDDERGGYYDLTMLKVFGNVFVELPSGSEAFHRDFLQIVFIFVKVSGRSVASTPNLEDLRNFCRGFSPLAEGFQF
ncbi:hypothetical protein Trydic_g10951 [Trypoxylus dichotomus]